MGYGGDLIWTGVLKALNEETGRPMTVVHKPRLTDLLAGRLYDATVSLADSPIFRNNPRLRFNEAKPRGLAARTMDLALSALLKPWPLKTAFEKYIFRRAERLYREGGPRYVHVDMAIHSYAERQLADRFIWKQGGHATAVIARRFTKHTPERTCEIYFSEVEENAIDQFLATKRVASPFIALDNGTNRDWFGDLRAWPAERWQETVDRLRADRPDISVVQIGLESAPPLDGVVDLRGQTNFREAALVIKRSALFIGTEGGPMHAARAVEARSVILWGGVTLPEFAGYPDHHRVVCAYAPCAPCGLLGCCNKGHICMKDITVDDALAAIDMELETTT